MKDESYWKKFWVSGRVDDYLGYTGESPCDSYPQWKERDGVPNAGIDFCDRYGDQPNTCG